MEYAKGTMSHRAEAKQGYFLPSADQKAIPLAMSTWTGQTFSWKTFNKLLNAFP